MNYVQDDVKLKPQTISFCEFSTYIFSSTVATTLGTIAGHPLDTVIVRKSISFVNKLRCGFNMRTTGNHH